MRVLVAHNYYQQAGGEDGVFHDETALLDENGDTVLTLERRNDELESAGIVGKAGAAAGTVWNRSAYREARRMIRESKPSVMHVHNTLPLLSPAIYHAARAEGVAVVQTLHNYRILCSGALFFRDGKVCEDCLGKRLPLDGIRHRCYRDSASATAAVTVSTALHRLAGTWSRTVNRYISMTEFGKTRFVAGGIPAERILVKPHFVRNAPGRGDGRGGYFLFVGRLTAEKGVHVLLEAWRQQQTDYELRVVGTGPEADSMATAATGLTGVQLLGSLQSNEVLELMQGAAAVIVPSLWYETFGRVVTEAFACATPVIVSDIGAIAELVRDGETGFRFRPGDADDLAEKMHRIAGLGPAVGAMRDSAHREFETRYTPAANYRMLMDVYRAAVDDASK